MNIEDLFQEIHDYLGVRRPVDNGVATEDDLIIIQGLRTVVEAARRKGYSEQLVAQVLHAVFSTMD